ncbi:PREDICTED: neuroglobin-like [Priapulus caudatus]|uniref:Neuroglobin-like n=1 Tax=Priapulus caudatus TaxID=37621 RepID=A0ABM1EFI7_PRICU|nr:PREDICTED: neuroglobin-like [Priapulus caudatus]
MPVYLFPDSKLDFCKTDLFAFCRLFLQHEELLAVFKKKFKDVPVDQLAKSPELENHASQVMSTLDEAIHSLNNLNFFFELLYTIGVTHRDIAGFRPEYFWRIEQPFLDAVKETLGERYTHNMEQIYQVTIKFIIDTLYKGYTKGAVK